MALDLGELSGSFGIDTNPLKRDLATGKAQLQGFVGDAEQAGAQAGDGFGQEFSDTSKAAMAAAGVGIAGALTYGLTQAMDREAAGGKLVAQLGLSPAQQERLGRVAGTLYANAYGESFGEVTSAVAAVRGTLDDLGSSKGIRRASADALNLAATFEYDVTRSVQIAGQLINTGLVKNNKQAFDLITAGSQRVPAAVREDLLDAADEYGQFFATIGYDGREAFRILVAASEDGMYGLDKTGDALKEFTIRSTDMSTTSRDAYKLLGLDARDMADQILAGGDDAQRATQKIIDALLSIESPSTRANAAIALFGTPLEDLNVREIPAFLRSLQDTKGGMEDVSGAAKRMGDAIGDNASTDFTKLKRGLEKDLVEFMAKDVIPFLRDDFVPAVESVGDAFDSVPSWVWKGTAGGFLGLLAAGKLASGVNTLRTLRGIGGGGTGALSTVASMAKPVPVFVTNPGGIPGGGPSSVARNVGTGATLATLASTIGKLPKFAPLIPLGLDSAPGQDSLMQQMFGFGFDSKKGDPRLDADSVGGMAEYRAALDQLAPAAREALQETAAAFKDAEIPAELKTQIALMGVPESMREARALVEQYNLTPPEKRTLFELLGFETTMARLSAIDRAANEAAQDRRLQISVEYAANGYETRGGLQQGGGTKTIAPRTSAERSAAEVPAGQKSLFNIEQIVAADFGDVMRQTTRLHQQASLGGRPVGMPS